LRMLAQPPEIPTTIELGCVEAEDLL
jgi:hypothetical protein